jgi:glycosyltransferase involved in cell wall biosynthesis/predicted O-methyltransferase YrrM
MKWLETFDSQWKRSENIDELKQWLNWLKLHNPKSILEIGTRTGSNLYLMSGVLEPGGKSGAVDYTSEFSTQRRAVENKLREEGIECKIRDKVNSSSLDVGEEWDCVYIDGNHSYNGALSDWKKVMLILKPGGCIGFHDTCHWSKKDKEKCSALWYDAQKFLGDDKQTWETPTVGDGAKELMGIGAVAFRERLLFIINGGLGDAAEMTRVALVASKLGYIVHVMVISGFADKMKAIWDRIPWITYVTKQQASKLHYKAILCPTRFDVLEQRAQGISHDILTNGNNMLDGSIIKDWQNVLISIGEDRDKVISLMPEKPLSYLFENTNKDTIVIAPGVGSALNKVEKEGAPDKRYNKWEDVIRYLSRPVSIIGNDKAYEPWIDNFKNDKEVINYLGKDINDTLPILAKAKVVFCPDNGLGHLSSLLGIPTVSVFNGVTNPKKFAPPEAIVINGTNETIKPGIVSGQMHYIINSDCIKKADLITDKLLSVIITCHNEGDEVLLTCQDVYERAGCPVEIIVIDDGSTDKSCDNLPSYVKVIHNKEKTGVAPARNQGVINATGEAFMFLDAHMRVLPGTPARMLLAALEKEGIIVSGVSPLYNPGRGATWTCSWEFRNGKLRSRWVGGCSLDFEPTNSFVAPGWVITRREWEKIGPWPESLHGWGSTEVCKSLQAFMSGVPIIAMKKAITWHRFRNRFPYHVSPSVIFHNAYIVARIMFGEKIFNDQFLPAMRKHFWSKQVKEILDSDTLKRDITNMESRRKVNPEKFMEKFFSNGLPSDQTDKQQPEKPQVIRERQQETPKEIVKNELPKKQHNSFFESVHCTGRMHCRSCRTDINFRKSICHSFGISNTEFDCPFGININNIPMVDFFSTDICKSKHNCKQCRTQPQFRRYIAKRFSVPSEQYDCPNGIKEEHFKDGKFPPLVEQAKNLINSAVTIAKDSITGKPTTVSEEEHNRRLDICKQCDIYDSKLIRCRKCGCHINIKSKLASMVCPIGKW